MKNKILILGLSYLVGVFGAAVALKAIEIHKEKQNESNKENCSTVMYSLDD